MKRRNFIITGLATAPLLGIKINPGGSKTIAKGFVLKQGEDRFNEDIRIGGLNPVAIKVSAADTDGTMSMSEYTGFTKGGPPLHIHPFQDEMFYIIEGEHLFQLGDEQFRLTAGDTVFIPRNVPHAPAQLSEKGRYIYCFTPSGKMEDFFRALATIKTIGQPSPQEMKRMFEDHQMKIVGPPLTLK